MKKTIEETLRMGLCTGCGTCVSLCPYSTIKMIEVEDRYLPKLDKTKCNQCGICFEVCPGHSLNFKDLNSMIFATQPQDFMIGNYINCYIGHATDTSIRYNSASGGLITALLIFALEEKVIDGALVTKMKSKEPLRPEIFIAHNRDEILSASNSKYCPVPANIALREILNGDGKLGLVGLPCHIHGIRKAEMINEKLRKKIVLHLGLICNYAPTFLATEYLLQKMKLKKENVKEIKYRGEGWPGRLSLTLKNGTQKSIQHWNPFYWGHVFNSYFFTPRCMLCNDKPNQLADISFGDAWSLSNDNIGKSIIISRNKIAEELLQKAVIKKEIEIEEISSKEVLESQAFDYIKRQHKARILLFKSIGKKVPIYDQEILESKISDYFKALLIYLNMYISSKRYLWNLIDIYPSLLMRIKGQHEN